MQAMILAAGLGERLKPLTEHTPKPLLMVQGKSLIIHQLLALRECGFSEVIINVHYLADQIQNRLGDGTKFDLRIHYSYEPELLGTAGAILNILPLWHSQKLLVVSSDIYTDYPLEKILKQQVDIAHLVMVPNPSYHPNGDFYYENGILSENSLETNASRYTFGNISIYDREFFKHVSPGYCALGPLIRQHLPTKRVSGEVYHGTWFNIGTAQELAQANAC